MVFGYRKRPCLNNVALIHFLSLDVWSLACLYMPVSGFIVYYREKRVDISLLSLP